MSSLEFLKSTPYLNPSPRGAGKENLGDGEDGGQIKSFMNEANKVK